MEVRYESMFIKVGSERVHLNRINDGTPGTPVFLIHGLIENGKIFYSKSGKGLAPYLASRGFDCFVIDLPGRGLSTPRIDHQSDHDLVFYIEKVIPAAVDFIKQTSGQSEVVVTAHSWGGVLMLAALAIRNIPGIARMVFIATKRHISIRSLKKTIMINVVWRNVVKLFAYPYGYYPAKEFRIGADNETIRSFAQSDEWLRSERWYYFDRATDISALLQQMVLPPLLTITGAKDDVLGHPTDVQLLLRETGDHPGMKFMLAGRSEGFSRNYGHVDILTHPVAVKEVFPIIAEWFDAPGGLSAE